MSAGGSHAINDSASENARYTEAGLAPTTRDARSVRPRETRPCMAEEYMERFVSVQAARCVHSHLPADTRGSATVKTRTSSTSPNAATGALSFCAVFSQLPLALI